MRACTSVVIPVRNGAAFIVEAISSALSQLQGRDEIIVVDDGSTDNTRSLVRAVRDYRVTMLEIGGRGVSAARNAGLAIVENEFVAFLDHDDLWPEGRHKNLLAALCDGSSDDAAFGRIRVKFEQGVSPSSKYLAMDGRFVHRTSVCTGLFRLRIVTLLGGFDEQLHFAEDIDFNMRLRAAGAKIRLCEIDSLIYRRHLSNSTNDDSAALDGYLKMLHRKIVRARQGGRPGT